MEKRRFIFFLALWGLVIVGTFAARAWLFPPPPKPEAPPPPPIEAATLAEAGKHAGQWLPGVTGALPVPPEDRLAAVHQEHKREQARKQAEADLAKRQAEEAARPDEAIVLGADTGYKLKAVLSTRGAAVRTITLNEYLAAEPGNAKAMDHKLILVNDDLDGALSGLPADKKIDQLSFRLLVEDAPLAWERVPKAGADQEERDEQGNLTRVIFATKVPGKNARIVKIFSLAPGDYHVGLRLRFENDEVQRGSLKYTLTGPRGVPVEGQIWKTTPFRHIMVTSVDAKNPRTVVRHMVDAQSIRAEKVDLPTLGGGANRTHDLQFAGVMSQYFAALVVVDGNPVEKSYIDDVKPLFLGDDPPPLVHGSPYPLPPKAQGRITANLNSREIALVGDKAVEHNYLLYTGPAKVSLLGYESGVTPGLVTRYDSELHLDTLTDYPSNRFFGMTGITTLVVFMTNVMHWLLETLHWVLFGQYWLAIIALTIIVRAAMFPISRKQALTSLRMQALAPELNKLKEKFKNNPQEMAAAQMELYRKYGVNPASGCIVILIQMPIMMGLYYALSESVHLRLASFLWIDNLSAPDMLLYWGGNWASALTFGFVNLGPYLNILPLMAVALMVVQQKLLMPPPTDEQTALNQKMMNFMMIFMGYMFYWVAAGLCIYFVVSSLWGMLERKLLPKIEHFKPDEPPKPTTEKKPERSVKNGKPDGFFGRIANFWNELVEMADKERARKSK